MQDTHIYTIHTTTGQEHKLVQYLDTQIEEGLVKDRYIPLRELPRKVGGKWTSIKEKLFPSYVFVETDDPEKLFLALKKVPMLSRILSDDAYTFYTLTQEEVDHINRIANVHPDHTFGISQVMIDSDQPYKPGDKVVILSGDLAGFEGQISRYDFHHRKAYIHTGLFGGTDICVGIELVKKQV